MGHVSGCHPAQPQPRKGSDGRCRLIIGDSAIRIGNAMNPEVVVLAGILNTTEYVFLEPLRETLRGMFSPDTTVCIKVLPARYLITGSALKAAMMAVNGVDEHIDVSTKFTGRSS